MNRNVLKSSLQNASFSIVFQILSRCITFGINAFIVRHVGREVLGIMNVRLLLLESTLIFLSREAISRAALSSRTQHSSRATWPQLINQMWITVPICLLLSLPFTYIWLYQLSPVEAHYAAAYRFSCLAIASACILEMTAEAPIFVAQVFCFVRLKVILDTLHILVRSIVFVTLVTTGTTGAIHAFGIAQLASATTIVSGNYLFFHVYIGRLREYRTAVRQAKEDSHAAAADGDVPGVEDVPLVTAALKDHFGSSFEQMHDFPFGSVRDMCPGVLAGAESPFNSDLQRLVLSFAKQVVFKQVLTEGEKLVMSVSTKLSFSEQATYDIVNNMGSMAARFIFRPVEDSSYFYYTQTIARDVRLEQQAAAKVHECGRVLQNLCKAISSIGLLAFVFGQSYAGTVLLLYGGPEFVRDGLPETLLRWHSLAIVLLAVNGITEGFMFATTTSRDIDAYNWYMAGFSAIFLVLSYYLISLFGPVGFILANCTNMALRIAYSSQYIVQLFRPMGLNPLSGFVPGKLFLAVLGAAGLLCKVSEAWLLPYSILYHLLVGVCATMLTLLAWTFENKQLYDIVVSRFR